MTLILDHPMQDDAASTFVAAAVGNPSTASANTNTISEDNGGGDLPKTLKLAANGASGIELGQSLTMEPDIFSFGFFGRASAVDSESVTLFTSGEAGILGIKPSVIILAGDNGEEFTFEDLSLTLTDLNHFFFNLYTVAGTTPNCDLYINGVFVGTKDAPNYQAAMPDSFENANATVDFYVAGLRCYDGVRTQPQIQADKEIGLPTASDSPAATSVNSLSIQLGF